MPNDNNVLEMKEHFLPLPLIAVSFAMVSARVS